MTDRELAEWLVTNGGPAISYRAATELLDEPDSDARARELMGSALVRRWLERLAPPPALGAGRGAAAHVLNQIHGSKSTVFESVMGKLTQLGCRAGMAAFDARTEAWPRWLEVAAEQRHEGYLSPFLRALVAAFLMMAGYYATEAVATAVQRRLDLVSSFARRKDYDIYVDRDTFGGLPKAYRKHRLVNPKLYPNGEMMLPSIYDINAFASMPDRMLTRANRRKLDLVVEYILDERYQRLPHGYGVAYQGERRYLAIGWDVKLPGYFGFEPPKFAAGSLVQRVELMARFARAREHRWFREGVAHLEGFRTERGSWLFPRSYLQKKAQSYWVSGGYMGLEESRRSSKALELESTFWMLKIRRLAGLG